VLDFLRDEYGQLKKITPTKMPVNETVWAMTVNKSRGSEFDRVLLVLFQVDIPVITREITYPGVTLARLNVEIWAGKAVLMRAISRKISRQSDLSDALRNICA